MSERGEQPEVLWVEATDGAQICCKRKPAAGRPVIFVHGLAVNADLWDIPEVRGASFTYRSLPQMLRDELDCDVWLMNLRGHGGPDRLSRPPEGQTDWCVDHFILYDLPAVIEHVGGVTGQRPFAIANSMGAMSLAGYLQGAGWADGEKPRIVANPGVARERQAQIAGAVFVEFPAALRWPRGLYDEAGRIRWRELFARDTAPAKDGNYPFEVLARLGWIEALLVAAGEVRLDWLRPPKRGEGGFPESVAQAYERMLSGLGGVARWLKGWRNYEPEMFSQGLLPAVDHMKSGVLAQLAKGVRAGCFVSALGSPDHVYSEHYAEIEVPSLVLLGGNDQIASAAVTREVFFDRIAAVDKTMHVFEDLAHGEFEYSPAATEHVYPLVTEWLRERGDLDGRQTPRS